MRYTACTLIILLFASTSVFSQTLSVKQDLQVVVDTIEDLKIQEEVLSINGSAFIPADSHNDNLFTFRPTRSELYFYTSNERLEDFEVTLTAPVNLTNGATIKRLIVDFDIGNENSDGSAEITLLMLPPMAIFFPLFTLLEDFGYLPRVAFNMDALFKKTGAHGKQALTMSMGWGCNAAGVIATRIIDSPRERLIAIITNNFSLCNGRWPTQILIATIFIGAIVPASMSGVLASASVISIALLGVGFMFLTSWALTKTVLQGEV